MLQIKQNGGVKLAGLKPQIVLAAAICSDTFDKHRCDCVITSANDSSEHMIGSKHYYGEAIDIRTKNIDHETMCAIVEELKLFLGEEFDVVLESDHLHVEYDDGNPPQSWHRPVSQDEI